MYLTMTTTEGSASSSPSAQSVSDMSHDVVVAYDDWVVTEKNTCLNLKISKLYIHLKCSSINY